MKKLTILLTILLLLTAAGCKEKGPQPDPEKQNITEGIFTYHFGDGLVPSENYDMELVLQYPHNDERGYQVVYHLLYSCAAVEEGTFEKGTMEYILDDGIDASYFADAVLVQTPYENVKVIKNKVIILDKQWEFYGGMSMKLAIADIKSESKNYQSCDLYFSATAKDLWYPKDEK